MRGLFQTEPDENRGKLGFQEAALSSFTFLEKYGLRPVEKSVTIVRWESDIVFTSVYQGRASFEIGAEIGRLDQPELYGLGYIVSWAGNEAWDVEGFGRGTMFQVSTREGVQHIVPRVAALVEKYGDPFLAGDPDFYDKLRRSNERKRVEFERVQKVQQIRKTADAAWAAKDFGRVAQALESIQSDLTNIESKRLEYARKHR